MGLNLRERIWDIISIIFIAIMVMGLYTVFVKLSDPIRIEGDNVQMLYTNNEYDQFSLIASRFSEMHEYQPGVYNCQNYTRDFYAIASHLGFNVQKVRGCPIDSNETCHMWVRLIMDYEPQTGDWIDYDNEYPIQTIILS